ncbi:MAG: hypothetical protein C0417_06815 [Chlorobiaceae bacterium]|nr:hypothetical protein [Chlorobiaceae bacterium]
MIGNLRNHWSYTVQEIWEPLLSHTNAPEDLFIALFDAVERHLGVETPAVLYEQIRNDPVTALVEFENLKGTDFKSESSIAQFIEDAYPVIEDYGVSGYGEKFKSLLRTFITKYNLRYRLDDPFELRFLLPGSFANLYNDLRRINATSPTLVSLMSDFEYAFNQFSRTLTQADLKTCIAKASNYAEGLASFTNGNPTAGNTLGALCNLMNTWPHDKVKESIVNLYHFCSDYPGLRHGGSPIGVRRGLSNEDPILVSILLFAFSGYLTTNLNKQEVLGA